MNKGKTRPSVVFRFSISAEDPLLTEEQVTTRIQIATADATEAALPKLRNLRAATELAGGFGGLGETVVLLTIWHVAKAVVTAASLGAASSAGKMFFEEFLSPRLHAFNLRPSGFSQVPSAPSTKGLKKLKAKKTKLNTESESKIKSSAKVRDKTVSKPRKTS